VMFLVAVGFWNFLGAGIFGFLINLPIVSYYEIGTALTANHEHAAMMGVYGCSRSDWPCSACAT
jgi:nitric oxide reductase subunit B